MRRYRARQVWCKGDTRVHSACRGVELGHELAVGCPGGGQVLVAFVELHAQVDDLLLEDGDLVVEGIDVGGRAEPGFLPCLLAERVG